MKIFELEFDDEQLTNFIINEEADIQVHMPANKILTDQENDELSSLSSEIASIIRNGFIRFVNSKKESEEE